MTLLAELLVATSILTGTAHVVDGDTIRVDGFKVRLHGIDAPERRQTCERPDGEYYCGKEATAYLKKLIQYKKVSCRIYGRDVFKRRIGECRLLPVGLNINGLLVHNGHAVAYRHYSKRYVPVEEAARQAGRGIWGGIFEMPWEYRKRKRRR